MATWREIAVDAPGFAGRVHERFSAGTNKTIATLRRDGSPRISGTELEFDGERVTLGMMPGSRKLADVERDPRVAIHSPTLEPPKEVGEWRGDAKLSGRLLSIAPPNAEQPEGAYFALDIREAVLTFVDAAESLLIVQSWVDGRGFSELRRK
ncbi:pyridoxamine 5'-phosphate oxidase family protein [Naasia lichenicola]|uniref:Pyridoxamine 5-phosphate oxidase n=1 Tax=Naasia lichenicola TaxID=2565933 RepID=A0A4V3WTR0_9MICO|nr:pyridoxamine 5'-phosphate oxidase family protein [Naasia lichenicola]THG32937.1 pyridoxamine 5-phosphate oxidase [Naasia lichenicola]